MACFQEEGRSLFGFIRMKKDGGSVMAKKKELSVRRKVPLRRRLWDQRYLFLLMLPGLIWVLIICYAPMTGLYMAFTNYRPSQNGYFYDLLNAKFVGFQWFDYFFKKDFSMIMRNTLATSFLTLLFSFPAPIILALMLNEVRTLPVKKFIQTASYLPYFISWVIASNIFLTFLSGNGLINDILMGLGLINQRILFFQIGPYFWWIIAIANTWKAMGYNAIIYLSAISGIDQQMYEAAEVDGASRVKRIWHITLPTIRPTISILLILAIGGILSTGFEQQLLMGNNAILNYSDVLDTYSYRYGLAKGMYSYGTAVGLFKSVVSFILVMSANRITAKLNDSALF